MYSNSLIWMSHYNANEQVQVKLDKDYTATISNASSSAGESKEKLAALREKRRLREAGTTAASNVAATPAVPAGGPSLKSDSLKSTGEEESGVEIDSLSQKDNQNDAKESGNKIMMMCLIKGSYILTILGYITYKLYRRVREGGCPDQTCVGAVCFSEGTGDGQGETHEGGGDNGSVYEELAGGTSGDERRRAESRWCNITVMMAM
jgi:hypothetical protein